jgi:hypothetical protein
LWVSKSFIEQLFKTFFTIQDDAIVALNRRRTILQAHLKWHWTKLQERLNSGLSSQSEARNRANGIVGSTIVVHLIEVRTELHRTPATAVGDVRFFVSLRWHCANKTKVLREKTLACSEKNLMFNQKFVLPEADGASELRIRLYRKDLFFNRVACSLTISAEDLNKYTLMNHDMWLIFEDAKHSEEIHLQFNVENPVTITPQSDILLTELSARVLPYLSSIGPEPDSLLIVRDETQALQQKYTEYNSLRSEEIVKLIETGIHDMKEALVGRNFVFLRWRINSFVMQAPAVSFICCRVFQ